MKTGAPRLPNFFVVGAHKSGTTSVARLLEQHPDVFVSPVKEPRYFALAGENRAFTGPDDPASTLAHATEEEYKELFSGAGHERAVGEASTLYLYHRNAAENIARAIPDARIIAILRHPVDRAYSNFLHCRRDGREPREEFLAALKEEASRIRRGWGPLWHYQSKGRYRGQLARYAQRFPAEHLLVATFDELTHDPVGLLQKMYRFLGVDDAFVPRTSERWNPGGVPRSVALQRALKLPSSLRSAVASLLPRSARRRIKHLVQKANLRAAPELPEDLRHELTQHLYAKEIAAVQRLTGLAVTEAWLPAEVDGENPRSSRPTAAAVHQVPVLSLEGSRGRP